MATSENMGDPLTIAVAGASGFIGRHLVSRLAEEHDVLALGRSEVDGEPWRGTSAIGRRCDLFSLKDIERALSGTDVAFYLVHSMMPTARLTQSAFEDMDATLADNFGRAAARAGVKQIIYLGGLIPQNEVLSKHLESRREVEELLGYYGVPVTVLRAGLVVGAGGSSLDMLVKLVGRLPVLICPSWTLSDTQPVALHDVVELLARSVGREEVLGRVFDVGGLDVLTYRAMIARTAVLMGVKRTIFEVPILTPRLSALWVSLVTGAPRALVGPLVESLKHPMVARDDELARVLDVPMTSFDDALSGALAAERAAVEPPVVSSRRARPAQPSAALMPIAPRPDVRSIQRIALPAPLDAITVTMRYMEWLPRFCRPWLRVEVDEHLVCRFSLTGTKLLLLELSYSHDRSTADRALLYITGGLLAVVNDGDRDRLEFRVLPGGREVLAAIHDFTPALPWFVYKLTQAPAHLVVMTAFARHLRRAGTPAMP